MNQSVEFKNIEKKNKIENAKIAEARRIASEIEKNLHVGIFAWYDFREKSDILLIDNRYPEDMEIYSDYLQEKGHTIERISVDQIEEITEKSYDYIIGIGAAELIKDRITVFKKLQSLLKTDGHLLLAVDNRFGLRYFCGDRDPFTDRNFDGIENYRRISIDDRKKMTGRCLSDHDIREALRESKLITKRMSVMPDIRYPQLFYAEDYLPTEELSMRYFPIYNCNKAVFLEEHWLYTDLIQNGMFHQMANGYFYDCVNDGYSEELTNAEHVTLAMDRGRENSGITIIKRNGTVCKKPVFSEGAYKTQALIDHNADLNARGIRTIEGKDENGSFVMPFVKAENGMQYFGRIIKQDKDLFVREMDKFMQIILDSAEHVAEPDEDILKDMLPQGMKSEDIRNADGSTGTWLAKGYLDLVPLNAFHTDDGFLFFDQEFCSGVYPARAIMIRALHIAYACGDWMERIIPQDFFYERYGLAEKRQDWDWFQSSFTMKLRYQTEMSDFWKKNGMDGGLISVNRQKINYSNIDYQRIFVDIFRDTDKKKLFLFGSGNFTNKFVTMYRNDFEICGLLDNNSSVQGTEKYGYPVISPDELKKFSADDVKVIICIKNYIPVLKQLERMGIQDVSVYDASMTYPHSRKIVVSNAQGQEPKKYKVGYIAGVFDLFHVGHLNLLRRAKEQCEYLIVGVVSDEAVRKNKRKVPVIPFEQRIEIIRGCRYVDEADEIPYGFADTDDAWRKYHFDAQFSGSDYADDPYWLKKQEWLREHGAELVFFPYTQETSSTKIKRDLAEE